MIRRAKYTKLLGSLLFVLAVFLLGDNVDTTTSPLSPALTSQGADVASPATPTQQTALNLFLVTRVIDGDTVEIAGGQHVRYIGIDTPESVDPRKPVQCFGKEASQRNTELVLGKEVRLVKDVRDRDQYGRLLRYVYIGDTFINKELVVEGYAHAATFPPDVAHAKEFAADERGAREAKRGLWDACPTR